MTKPITVLKSCGPKLVPFFKTVTIFFVLYPVEAYQESIVFCAIKCLPVISLIVFILLHGMNFTEYYSYSRKILVGLIFSCLGDAFLVWDRCGYFNHGVFSFAVAQAMYIWAFGFRPLKLHIGAACALLSAAVYNFLLPGLKGPDVVLVGFYLALHTLMLWRAIARWQIFEDWPWTRLCSCVGAALFYFSDFVIGTNTFRFNVLYSHPMIMTSYYAAQLGITLSVVDSHFEALMEKKTM